MNEIKSIIVGVIFSCTLWLTGCHNSEDKGNKKDRQDKSLKITQIVEHKPKAPQPKKIDASPISVPTGMQKAAAWQHTDQIGTADHPTIDGGIINAADGIPVYHTEVKPAILENSISKVMSQDILESRVSLSDHWATSTKVKTILENAAQTGKLGIVLNESAQNHLPASVALLPIVESAYQDNAISSKGAVGAWQLMPKTAQENGLSAQDRTAFMPATQAALHYLNQLHQHFGNWTLAFAAYNAGQGRVMKALQKNPTAASIEDLDLPQETKAYINMLMYINQALLQENQPLQENS